MAVGGELIFTESADVLYGAETGELLAKRAWSPLETKNRSPVSRVSFLAPLAPLLEQFCTAVLAFRRVAVLQVSLVGLMFTSRTMRSLSHLRRAVSVG